MKSFLILLMILSILTGCTIPEEKTTEEKFVIGYIFKGDRLLDPDKIPANKFSHINYAFSNIKDGKVVEGFKHDTENYRILNSLKKQNPKLKILSSVGGWTWSGDFSDAALTPERRSVFAKSARDFLVKHQLDGIDIDWEYPNLPGYGNKHRPEDIVNFTLLMKELRKELDEQGEIDNRHYLTSAACGGRRNFIENTEMGETHKYMDFVNLMTYDLYESELDTISGHHASLYTNPLDPKKISADAVVKNFIDAGVPAEKIILGFPFYGRAWGDVDTANHGLYQKGGDVRIRSSHRSIVENLLIDNSPFQRHWDSTAQAPFLWNPTERIFIGYDDIESVTKKCDYIKEHNLLGSMFWAYGSDYKNTYLNTLNLELRPESCEKNELLNSDLGAGFRFSSYGTRRRNLDEKYWENVGKAMSANFEGSTPETVWIVSPLSGRGSRISFPVNAQDTLIKGSEQDLYEKSLNRFDSLGFRVWLQVESGYASVDELLHLILKQYSHHKCVIGVGVDVEWYNSTDPDEGQAVSDEEALRWLDIAKSYNRDYKIFFKHWLIEKMPPTAREDMVFINDSQALISLDMMLKEFIAWGEAFYPAKVGFQYGYPSDRSWWSKYENPPKKLGEHFLEKYPQHIFSILGEFWHYQGIPTRRDGRN